VNNAGHNHARKTRIGLLAGALLCMVYGSAFAQNSGVSAAELISEDQDFAPLPLLQTESGLAFDTADSETRKLQLQLAGPLNLQTVTQTRWSNLGGSSLLAGTSLEWMATENLGITSGFSGATSQVQFQPVGSIHCQNGILEAGSYRASDCYFTNDANDLNMGIISIGAEYDFGNSAMAAINLFRQESTFDARGAQAGAIVSPVLDAGLTGAVLSNPILSALGGNPGLDYLDTEVSGIDLEFKLGVSTDSAGDMQLGLQFTHVLDGSYQGLPQGRDAQTNWTLAEPFDSAKLSFDWRKNSFSGGVQGFYREPVEFLNRSNLDAMTTFDVYFTWRAPWNASLSVGASNVLNSGMDESGNTENTINDPFEAVYGRIPYVRYQQDL
jgi:hypothetical protein